MLRVICKSKALEAANLVPRCHRASSVGELSLCFGAPCRHTWWVADMGACCEPSWSPGGDPAGSESSGPLKRRAARARLAVRGVPALLPPAFPRIRPSSHLDHPPLRPRAAEAMGKLAHQKRTKPRPRVLRRRSARIELEDVETRASLRRWVNLSRRDLPDRKQDLST
jgi:hypothetical protein